MRYDAEHKERTRRKLLQQAAAALRARGPEQVSVATLMRQLGLTHGGFYAHFQSKEDLVAQAVDEIFDEICGVLRRRTEGLPPAAALARYVDFYLSAEHCDQPARGCPLPSLAADMARAGGVAQRHYAAGVGRLLAEIAALFQRSGHTDAEAGELASSLMSELAGAIALARAMDQPERAAEILAHSQAAIRRRFDLPPAG